MWRPSAMRHLSATEECHGRKMVGMRLRNGSLKRARILAMGVGILLSLTACGADGLGSKLAQLPVSATGTRIAVGVSLPMAPQDPTDIDAFSSLIHRKPDILMWYVEWVLPDGTPTTFSDADMRAVAQRGMAAMITWEPWNWTKGLDQPAFSLKTIVDGQHDAYIRSWARAAANWGQPFFLRFAHEMNGDWYPWSPGVNGNTAADYIQAWRHVVDIFRQEGADNVIWVWSPNVEYSGIPNSLASVYPGDAYVDWVGLDGYNYGTLNNGTWRSLATLFVPTYDKVTKMTDKPIMIAETASTEVGGNKADWITQGFEQGIRVDMPRVRAVTWFEHDSTETDWRVSSSAASLSAFRTVVNAYPFE